MGRKKRSQNNNVRRERYAVKELARLKKCLGLIDEKGNEISKEVADIAIVTDGSSIKMKQEEDELQMLVDGEPLKKPKKLKKVEVVNDKTQVTHIYNAKTKKDQFGNYPVWYKRQGEKKKKKIKGPTGDKTRRNRRYNLFNVTEPYKNVKY